MHSNYILPLLLTLIITDLISFVLNIDIISKQTIIIIILLIPWNSFVMYVVLAVATGDTQVAIENVPSLMRIPMVRPLLLSSS